MMISGNNSDVFAYDPGTSLAYNSLSPSHKPNNRACIFSGVVGSSDNTVSGTFALVFDGHISPYLLMAFML
jgi:hypothetical protein